MTVFKEILVKCRLQACNGLFFCCDAVHMGNVKCSFICRSLLLLLLHLRNMKFSALSVSSIPKKGESNFRKICWTMPERSEVYKVHVKRHIHCIICGRDTDEWREHENREKGSNASHISTVRKKDKHLVEQWRSCTAGKTNKSFNFRLMLS